MFRFASSTLQVNTLRTLKKIDMDVVALLVATVGPFAIQMGAPRRKVLTKTFAERQVATAGVTRIEPRALGLPLRPLLTILSSITCRIIKSWAT